MEKLPVLDDDTSDAEVIGWASTRAAAMRIVMREAARREAEGPFDVRLGMPRLKQTDDIHRPGEAARVNRAGKAWFVECAP